MGVWEERREWKSTEVLKGGGEGGKYLHREERGLGREMGFIFGYWGK